MTLTGWHRPWLAGLEIRLASRHVRVSSVKWDRVPGTSRRREKLLKLHRGSREGRCGPLVDHSEDVRDARLGIES